MTHKKVIFQENQYWLHSTSWGYSISPLDHYTEKGELLKGNEDSFAVIVPNGEIHRYGQVIGKITDLIDVDK